MQIYVDDELWAAMVEAGFIDASGITTEEGVKAIRNLAYWNKARREAPVVTARESTMMSPRIIVVRCPLGKEEQAERIRRRAVREGVAVVPAGDAWKLTVEG